MGIPQQEAQQYSTWKLKQRLKGYFQGKLSFIERSSYSDLLCSSSITVGDAPKKAASLHADLSDQDEPDLAELSNTPSMPMEMNEALVLHRDAGLLRNLPISTYLLQRLKWLTVGVKFQMPCTTSFSGAQVLGTTRIPPQPMK